MKKNLICILFCSTVLFNLSAQSYELTVTNEPFEFLTGGTSVLKEVWDDPALKIPVGFGFEYFGETVDTLYTLEDFTSFFAANLDLSSLNLIFSLGADLIDRGIELDSSISPIFYKTIGQKGSRILTVEYNNAGFFGSDIGGDGIYIDYINFQLRLFEESGMIETHIGPYLIEEPEFVFDGGGPIVGLVEGYNDFKGTALGEVMLLKGDALKPQIITVFEESYVTWPIPENTVYRFTRTPSGVFDKKSLTEANYYFPNPASQSVFLRTGFQDDIKPPVKIIDYLGNTIAVDQQPTIIEMDHLPAGMYYLKFLTPSGFAMQRISLIK